MGILDSLASYNKRWEEAYRDHFSESELSSIDEIEVVASQYGTSARVSTGTTNSFISMHKDNPIIPVGTKLDKSLCCIIHLVRGEQTTVKLLYEGTIE